MKIQCPFSAKDGLIILKSEKQDQSIQLKQATTDQSKSRLRRKVITFVEKLAPKPGEVFDIDLVPCMGGRYAEYTEMSEDEYYLSRYSTVFEDGITSYTFDIEDGELVPRYAAHHTCSFENMSMFNATYYVSHDDYVITESRPMLGFVESTQFNKKGYAETVTREYLNHSEAVYYNDGLPRIVQDSKFMKSLVQSPSEDTFVEAKRSCELDSKMYYEHTAVHSSADDVAFLCIDRNRNGKLSSRVLTMKPTKATMFRNVNEQGDSGPRFTEDGDLTRLLNEMFIEPTAPEEYEIEMMGLRIGMPVILLDVPPEYRERLNEVEAESFKLQTTGVGVNALMDYLGLVSDQNSYDKDTRSIAMKAIYDLMYNNVK